MTKYLFLLIVISFVGFGCSINKLAANSIANALSGDDGTVFSGDIINGTVVT